MRNIKTEDGAAGILRTLDRSHAILALTTIGTVVRANRHFLTTLGYTEAELIGAHVPISFGKRDLKLKYREMWLDLRKGKARRGLFEYMHKDGRAILHLGSYTPVLSKSGKVSMIVLLALDLKGSVEGAQDFARLSSNASAAQTSNERVLLRIAPANVDACSAAFSSRTMIA